MIVKKISSLVFILAILFTLLTPVSVFADIKEDVCSGVGLSSGGSCKTATSGSKSVNEVIATGLNVFSAIIGIIAVVMIMIAGVKYMTSQGEPGKINEAKNALLYAVVGIVVVAMAQIIVQFVIKRFS